MDMLLTDEELLRLPSIEIIKGRCYYTPEEIQDASISKTLDKIREVVEGAKLTDEEYFYLHSAMPYKCISKEMNAYLRGLGDGSKVMKQTILKAIKELFND